MRKCICLKGSTLKHLLCATAQPPTGVGEGAAVVERGGGGIGGHLSTGERQQVGLYDRRIGEREGKGVLLQFALVWLLFETERIKSCPQKNWQKKVIFFFTFAPSSSHHVFLWYSSVCKKKFF